MSGRIVFVHGTGVRDVGPTLKRVQRGVQRVLGWPASSVVAVEWGRQVGPEPADVRLALPPAGTRGEGDDLDSPEARAALWELLLADPGAELRVLAAGPRRAALALDPTADPPGVVLARRLEALDVLEADGLPAGALRRARQQVEPAAVAAAGAVQDPDDPELTSAAARAVVAAALADQEPAPVSPEELFAAVLLVLAPLGTRGVGGELLRRVVGPLATRIAVRRRDAYMGPLLGFTSDIAFYVQRGEAVRDLVAEELRRSQGPGPLVLLGHSLGGIACVDLLSDPANRSLGVDLLVTAGSQAPLLWLMDALAVLRPDTDATPFTPWRNAYDRSDLLSFCAERVFAGTAGISDHDVPSGQPFPQSHSAYWDSDEVYALIRDGLP